MGADKLKKIGTKILAWMKGFFFGANFAAVVSVTLLAAAFIFSMMIYVIDTGKEQSRLFDFIAYIFPIIAGTVVGITALSKKGKRIFYALSCLVLVIGLFFYFVSKGLGVLGTTSAVSVLSLWPASNFFVDRWMTSNGKPWTWFLLPVFYISMAITIVVAVVFGALARYGVVVNVS